MDIDLFSEIVKGLILDNDEVALPGLGTFVSEVMPSTFSDKGYTINPPYRKLSFRQRQTGNDRLLAEFYSRTNGVDFETSMRIMSEFIAGLKSTLQNKKIVVFPGLGRLRATKENAFFFIADEELDIYPYGVGLEPVSLKTHEETPEEVAQSVAALRELVAEPEPAKEVMTPVTEPVEVTEGEAPSIGNAGSEDVGDVPVADVTEDMAPVTSTSSVTEGKGSATEGTDKTDIADGKEETGRKNGNRGWRVSLIVAAGVIGLAVVSLGIFMLLAHVAPEFIDSILYTPEELGIINY